VRSCGPVHGDEEQSAARTEEVSSKQFEGLPQIPAIEPSNIFSEKYCLFSTYELFFMEIVVLRQSLGLLLEAR
jgi:hypothetical protein